MYVPNIRGYNEQDTVDITEAVMMILDEMSRKHTFVDDFAYEVSQRGFDNEMFDDLVKVALDAVNDYDEWKNPLRVVEPAVMAMAANFADSLPDMDHRYSRQDVALIDDILSARNRGRRSFTGDSRSSRRGYGSYSGDRRSYGGREERRGYTTRRSERDYGGYGSSSRTMRGQRGLSENLDDNPVPIYDDRRERRQSPRKPLYESRREGFTDEPAPRQREASQPRVEIQPQRLPVTKEKPAMEKAVVTSTKSLNNGIYEHKTISGVETVIHQNSPLVADQDVFKWVCAPGSNVFFVNTASGHPVRKVISMEEINVDKSLHQTERFFKAWSDDSREDAKKTNATIRALQTKISVAALERELAEKYDLSAEGATASVAASKLIEVEGPDVGSGAVATPAEARSVISKAIGEDSILNAVDTDDLNIVYDAVTISPWALSGETKNKLLELKDQTTFTGIKEVLLELKEIVPVDVVADLNDRATRYINNLLHRHYGNDVNCIDSFLLDIDEISQNLHRLNIDESTWNQRAARLVACALNVVEFDEELEKKTGPIAEIGSVVVLTTTRVVRIGISSEELMLHIHESGIGRVSDTVFPALHAGLSKAFQGTDPNSFEGIVITTDGAKMYVSRSGDGTFCISRN